MNSKPVYFYSANLPLGIPNGFENYINLMFALYVLGYKSAITRIATQMMAGEGSNTRFAQSGVMEKSGNINNEDGTNLA